MENLLSKLVGLVQESTEKKETRREELIRVLSYIQTLCNLNRLALWDDDGIDLAGNLDEYRYVRYYFDCDDADYGMFYKCERLMPTGEKDSEYKRYNITQRVYTDIIKNHLPKILEKEIKKFEDESEAADKIQKLLNVINN